LVLMLGPYRMNICHLLEIIQFFLGKSKKNSYSNKNKSVKQNGGKAVPKTKGDLKLNIIT